MSTPPSGHHQGREAGNHGGSRLDPLALGALVMMQQTPRRYGERRTEHFELHDNKHYAVKVDFQFHVPQHGPAPAGELLIPLGLFGKDRLPDLTVTGPDGERLPVLSRSLRGQVVASLLGSSWQHVVFDGLSPEQQKEALAVWAQVLLATERIVTRPGDEAHELIETLVQFLGEYCVDATTPGVLAQRYRELLQKTEFWEELSGLAGSRLLIASMRGTPGRTYTANISYAESLVKDSKGTRHIRGLLAWLGLIAMPILRTAASCAEAESFWAVATAPEGVEILRLFWETDMDEPLSEESISIDANRALAGRYEWSGTPEQTRLLLDVQIAPSASILGTIGLALLLLYVSRYVYQGFPRGDAGTENRTLLLGMGALLVTIPATILGALAYRGALFSRYASRGPRVMVAALSGLAAALAVAVSLKGITTLTEVIGYILSVYCLFVIGIFAYIQIGFRWRNNDAARLSGWRKRSPKSPASCRRKQVATACAFFVFWVIVVIVYARVLTVLQHGHLLRDFPREIWDAWWS